MTAAFAMRPPSLTYLDLSNSSRDWKIPALGEAHQTAGGSSAKRYSDAGDATLATGACGNRDPSRSVWRHGKEAIHTYTR